MCIEMRFDGENKGTDLIDRCGIASETTLVTSSFLESDVISFASEGNIKIVPKVLIG